MKWLSFRAHLRIREANISLAIQDYQTAGRIASHAGEDPILIAGLVQIALNAITIRSIETAAAEAADATSAKPVLASLRSAATHIPEVPPLSRYFVGEAGMGYEFARNISRFKAELGDAEFSGGEFVGWRTFPPLIENELVERATASRVLRFWNEVLTLNNAVKWKPIRVHAESLLLEQRYVGTWRPLDYLAAILYPVFSHVGLAFEKSKVQRAVTLSMIDVLLFRERQGRLPKSLDEAKITTRDPFGDGPLQYRITKRGFRIYSVGADRKDERGRMYWEKTPAEQAMPSGDDIMAVYPASDRVDPRNAK